ncbi:hypothetical protein BDZ91DRAFT_776689 [Kalaharituber pfeilii]|nr:hypothetical protein BDZ91DRAFT_776689 [Kalaharituber pfeilii]
MTRDYADFLANANATTPRSRASRHADVTIDTVIIGNGPAALFLSYLLHGHVPYYDPVTSGPHPDQLLHRKLAESASKPLYASLSSPEQIRYLTEHFSASPMSYSSQAQRVNVLLDTLLRPNGDIDIGEYKSRIRWVKDESRVVDHVVLGAASSAGGQWSESIVATSSDISTLSYADMLSLPEYTFEKHYEAIYGEPMPPFTRPSRRDVSTYYSVYPAKVGISARIGSNTYVYDVERSSNSEFLVRALRGPEYAEQQPISLSIRCKHVVLASGIFTRVLPPPVHLQQIPEFCPDNADTALPLLVIGSGFTAADVILSSHPNQKIFHIFKWGSTSSSPLKGCHPQAYPEYARIYRQMKQAALKAPSNLSQHSTISASEQPSYEGFPNAKVVSVTPAASPGVYQITMSVPGFAAPVRREVGYLSYFVGRRGDLSYLSRGLQEELGIAQTASSIAADTLRARVAANVEIAKGVFAIGSLTGDSLVKFGFGSGTYTAGTILRDGPPTSTTKEEAYLLS